jgi:hypothetical protein
MDSVIPKTIFQSGVCVKKCPADTKTALDCAVTTKITKCNAHKSTRYASQALSRYCVPSGKLPLAMHKSFEAVKKTIKGTNIGKGVFEIYYARTAIYTSIATSLLICILFIYIMSYFSEAFIYLSLAAAWLGNIFGIYLFYTSYADL